MMKCLGFRVSGFGVGVGLFGALLLTSISVVGAGAAEVRDRAEAEGKLMFYATFNAADSKALTDAFKQLYPKIDATFYRATDAALMERILTESRAGQNLWERTGLKREIW